MDAWFSTIHVRSRPNNLIDRLKSRTLQVACWHARCYLANVSLTTYIFCVIQRSQTECLCAVLYACSSVGGTPVTSCRPYPNQNLPGKPGKECLSDLHGGGAQVAQRYLVLSMGFAFARAPPPWSSLAAGNDSPQHTPPTATRSSGNQGRQFPANATKEGRTDDVQFGGFGRFWGGDHPSSQIYIAEPCCSTIVFTCRGSTQDK